MKNLNTLLLISVMLAAAVSAQVPLGIPAPMTETPMAAAEHWADGEIRKIDTENKKITIKHGEIKNLDMPAMTMVFRVKDSALLGKAKAGDKIRFKAEKFDGSFVVTDIQRVPD